VNTVPTVGRLTGKLLKSNVPVSTEEQAKYPFCPLCLGLRDTINNLLEVGSTIKHIEKVSSEEESKENVVDNVKFEAVKSSDEWFVSDLEKAFCFGCKRLTIESRDKDSLVALLPDVIKINGQRTIQADNTNTI